MAFAEFLRNLLPSDLRTWPVTIEDCGQKLRATAFEENGYGMWHISYQVPGQYKMYVTKWITPTEEQRAARGW